LFSDWHCNFCPDYENDGFVWDMAAHGVYLGLGVGFDVASRRRIHGSGPVTRVQRHGHGWAAPVHKSAIQLEAAVPTRSLSGNRELRQNVGQLGYRSTAVTRGGDT
jgi:hypothetical protein